MNWRAIPETFQRRNFPAEPWDDARERFTPVLDERGEAIAHVGKIFVADVARYRSARSEASTSTKRNICTLKCSSRIENSIIR